MQTLPTGKPRGFTLLELLVVLFMMILMSGIVVAAMGPALADAKLRAGARTLIAALRYARSYAITYQAETEVVIDTERRGVSISTHTTDAQGAPIVRPVTTPAGRFRALPEGLTVAVKQASTSTDTPGELSTITITFSVLGQAAQDTLITVSDPKGRQRVIHLDALTGRCDCQDTAP